MKKVQAIVQALIDDYGLNPNLIYLVGGGGSASVVAPAPASAWASVTALQRTPLTSRPSVLRWRLCASRSSATCRILLKRIFAASGTMCLRSSPELAAPILETVDITVEIDSQKNILRATATGATELRTKDRGSAV